MLSHGVRLGLLAGALALGCAASPPPNPSPAPGASAQPRTIGEARPASGGEAPASQTNTNTNINTPESAPSPPASPESAAPAEPRPAPPPTITIELPYKLGERPQPASPDDAKERTRWNQGGRGTPAGELPPAEGHPLPRVIVEVVSVKGPHAAAAIQRIARASLWGRIIECYRPGAQKDQSLKGKTTIRFQVSKAGKPSRAKATASTLPDKDVAACLARQANTLELARAKAGSTVTATIQVYPGDDPIPPPPGALPKPGSGVLPPAEVRRLVLDIQPRIEACYRAIQGALPELWGRIEARLHVTAAGKVDEAFEAESRFPEESVTRCVLRELRALELPKPAGGDVRIIVPIRLAPGEPAH